MTFDADNKFPADYRTAWLMLLAIFSVPIEPYYFGAPPPPSVIMLWFVRFRVLVIRMLTQSWICVVFFMSIRILFVLYYLYDVSRYVVS